LIPFGDVHKSSSLHDKERWQSFLDWAKTKPRAYFLGMGDYNDLASTSERLILGSSVLHESTKKTMDELYMTQTMLFVKDIKFMEGRLIGILNGNHYGVFPSGITTDQKLAELMKTKFLGVSSLVRLQFNQTTKHHSRMSIDLFLHHGRGGGRTVGGSMNPVQAMAQSAEADIYLMGDNHQKGIDFLSRLRLQHGSGNVRLSHRKILLARTGSFLKGYEAGHESYIVDAQMSPSDLGVVKIELTPRREKREGEDIAYIDIHASI
jgi:hypothetical protein